MPADEDRGAGQLSIGCDLHPAGDARQWQLAARIEVVVEQHRAICGEDPRSAARQTPYRPPCSRARSVAARPGVPRSGRTGVRRRGCRCSGPATCVGRPPGGPAGGGLPGARSEEAPSAEPGQAGRRSPDRVEQVGGGTPQAAIAMTTKRSRDATRLTPRPPASRVARCAAGPPPARRPRRARRRRPRAPRWDPTSSRPRRRATMRAAVPAR